MTVIRTFLNAGAARGTGEDVDKTLQLLKDRDREFAASQYSHR